MTNKQRQTRKLRLHSKCLANCPAWRIVLAHVVYQLFRCCWPVGRSAKHLFNHWVINSVSQAVTQAVRFIDSFVHSVRWVVSKLKSANTDTDVWMLGGLGPAHGPPGAACCQLTAWCFYPSLAVTGLTRTSHIWTTLLIIFLGGGGGLQKKVGSGAFDKDCLCSKNVFWFYGPLLGFTGLGLHHVHHQGSQ